MNAKLKLNILNFLNLSLLSFFIQNISATKKLNEFNFVAASVLPVTILPNKQEEYCLFGREAGSRHKGTWDVFGGGKDKDEKHPILTAAREFAEETMLEVSDVNQSIKYIDLAHWNTTDIIANEYKKWVIYITKFDYKMLENFVTNFYTIRKKLLKQNSNSKLVEKDKIAWIKKDVLIKSITNAPQDSKGKLIRPIQVLADIIEPDGLIKTEKINLRPVFASTIRSFFKNDKNFVLGEDSRIRFYTK